MIYPIRDRVDGEGRQLVNWVAELETPRYEKRDWNRPGRLEDFDLLHVIVLGFVLTHAFRWAVRIGTRSNASADHHG